MKHFPLQFPAHWLMAVLFCCCTSAAPADEAAPANKDQTDLPALKLHYRTANQKILFIHGQNETEVNAMRKACAALDLKFESSPTWDTGKNDFTGYHTIIGGSNNMDFFGPKTADELKKDRIFTNIKQFVSNGGHLFLFNTVDGRHSERLSAFGLKPGPVQCSLFELIPGRSEVLFHQFEKNVPANHRVYSWASIEIDPAMQPVAMFRRKDTEPHPHEPMFATLTFQSGRVTYTTIEPFDDGMWLIPIVAKWISRGAPTNMNQLQEQVVVSRARLKELNARPPLPEAPKDLAGEDDLFRKQIARQVWRDLPREADPRKRYAALKTAWEIAAEAGDFDLVDLILKQAATEFVINESEIRRDLLELRRMHTTLVTPELADRALVWSEQATAQGDFVTAQQFALTAQQLAEVTADKELNAVIQRRLAGIEQLTRKQAELSPLLNEMSRNKLSPQQETTLGRYFCLTVGDWDTGLVHLGRGEQGELKQLALLDLEDPGDVPAMLTLARGWAKDLADLSESERFATHQRSRRWYYQAISNLNGQEKWDVEAEVGQLLSPPLEIRFQVTLEGRSRLEIDPDNISWTQLSGTSPAQVLVNSQVWNLSSAPVRKNQGLARYAQAGQEFREAHIQTVKGRSMVLVQRTAPGHIQIDLDDVPAGKDDYEFVVTIGRPPTSETMY